jgi:hypothetical protein
MGQDQIHAPVGQKRQIPRIGTHNFIMCRGDPLVALCLCRGRPQRRKYGTTGL